MKKKQIQPHLLSSSDTGQALVEFVIILIFIMAMCAGMVSSIRLLGFQFWAQQEARFLAYEQTWSPHDFYSDPVNDPIGKLNDAAYFGRPKIVSDRTSNKGVTDDGAIPELLAWLQPLATEKVREQAIGETDEAPVMLARNETPWWKEETSDWFREGGAVDRAFSFVDTAVASVDFFHSVRSEGSITDNTPENPFPVYEGNYQDRLQPKIKNYLIKAEVGPKVCDAVRGFSKRNGDPAALLPFRQSDCSEKVEEGLSWNLSHEVNIPDFFRGYGDGIQSGFTPAQAIEESVRTEVAEQFYSFFDTFVSTSRAGAVPLIVGERVNLALDLGGSSVTDLISDARYIGSSVAITLILAQGVNIGSQSPTNRSSDNELNFERSVNDMLQLNADDILPVVSPFFLGPQYLPVPPTFGAAAGGLQEAIMKNLLTQAADDPIRDEQIANANKMVEVSYDASGAFSDVRLAKDNIRGVETNRQVARYYLITQPWHMTRRQGGTGDYRQKGTQTDDDDEETEEGVMRRRVFGLFLFPSNPTVFLEPISDVLGLSDSLKGVFDAFSGFDSAIEFIKDFVLDNPLIDVAQTLSDIPFIGDIIPVPPKWPAVRPDAYPGSTEMTGNDPAQPDKLMGNDRNFSDYVDEQRDNDPEPEPDFN